MARPTVTQYWISFYRGDETDVSFGTGGFIKSMDEAKQNADRMLELLQERGKLQYRYEISETNRPIDDIDWARRIIERLANCASRSALYDLQQEAHEYLRECP